MTPEPPRIIEWFRADPWPRMRRVLMIGPPMLTAGGLVIAVSFLTHQAPDVRVASAALGLALTFGAATFTYSAMHRILREEVSLVVRTDGLAVQSARGETVVPWGELREVRWDEATANVVLERLTGEPLAVGGTFARAQGTSVVEAVQRTRRKAAMNLPF